MVKITARIDGRDFTRRIKKFPSDLQPTLQEAVRRDAKFFIREIIKVTPPFSQSARTGAQAKRAGEKKLERDIHRIYASSSFAYSTIKPPAAASAFWFILKGRGKNKNLDQARKILQANSFNVKIKNAQVVNELNPKYHAEARRNGVVKKVDVKEIVVKESSLNKYIRDMKKRVGWLAGGWAAAAEKLGESIPAWIKRHQGNGSIVRFLRRGNPNIIIKNNTRFATEADMAKRVKFVLGMTKRQKATEAFIRHDLRARWKKEFGF